MVNCKSYQQYLFMQRKLSFTSLLVFAAFIFFTPLFLVHAQNSVAGIGITPATQEGPANPGETQTHSVGVTNLSGVKQTYYLYLRDIIGVETGGVPVFADENEEKTVFELTQWLTLSTQEITLEPGEQQQFGVTMAVPENATPGSHFGGVFISMQPPRLRQTGAAVGYEVAHIISIRVAGDAVVNAQIRSFSTGNFIYGKPVVEFAARIENKGTVLVRPTGPLEIFNMFGKRVDLLTFNESKNGVFPMAEEEFLMTWEGEGMGFGRYQAILSLVYGDQGRQSTISSTASFWILPMNIILPALGVLAFLLLAAYISVKLYVNKTLMSATGGTRRIVRRKRQGGVSALLLVTIVMLAVTALFLIILLALFA